MKTLTQFILIILCLSLSSCEKSEIDGKATDSIKLSKDKIAFNSGASSETITTKSIFWWIENMSIDNVLINHWEIIDQSEWGSKDLEFTKDWLTLKRDGTNIKISVAENTTDKDRIFHINLQAGNWFGSSITVTQVAAK